MPKFVNYKKRGVSLPAGCKELIDLLEPGKRRQVKELFFPDHLKVKRDDCFTVHLSAVGKPISEVGELDF